MGGRTISLPVLMKHFPSTAVYREPRTVQTDMLGHVAKHGSALIEAPTGSGKTAVEYAIGMAMRSESDGSVFLITPNKTILDQIRLEFKDLPVALGRNEHPCLYYQADKNPDSAALEELRMDSENPRADQIPCSFLQDCPHRVDQETGATHTAGVTACPYLQQKYEAKKSRIVLSTMAFYLFTHLFGKEFDTKGLVIDEVHQLANVVRNALSYDITDLHIKRSEEILKPIAPKVVKTLRRFRRSMTFIARKSGLNESMLLKPDQILKLIDILKDIDVNELARSIKDAVRDGLINPREDRVTLKKLETLVRDLRRYVTTLEYSVPTEERKALNYTCAFQRREKNEEGKVNVKLVVKCYYVVPLIRKILPAHRVSLSATIGDPEIFGFETGIKDPFLSLPSNFPAANSRIYMPTDTANLAMNARNARDLPKSLRLIARSCKRLAGKGIRSLVVVVANTERDQFMRMAVEENLDAVSYGNGVTAKEAAMSFKDGLGSTLVGTAANYAEGIDLPKQIAPVIFVLRPSYPNPRDPGTQFEEERWGGQRWAIWNWRAMQQALQVRGRNIRSRSDIGVTFFVSQQFRRVVFGALPKHLQPVYKGEMTFEGALRDAEKLLEPISS